MSGDRDWCGSESRRPKRLEDFDLSMNPNVPPEVVGDVKSPAWVSTCGPLGPTTDYAAENVTEACRFPASMS